MYLHHAKRLCIPMSIVAAVVFSHTIHAAPPASQQFSADLVNHEGKRTSQGKLYFGQNKMRTETSGNVVIARLDKKVCYVVMPSEHMYMEQPLNPQMLPKTSKELEGEVERVPMGTEIIDGRKVEKFKVIYLERSARAVMYQWLMDSGFPVKMEAEDGSWGVEYKNISFASQPDALFEPPDGFQKMAIPFSGGSGMPSMDDIMRHKGAEK